MSTSNFSFDISNNLHGQVSETIFQIDYWYDWNENMTLFLDTKWWCADKKSKFWDVLSTEHNVMCPEKAENVTNKKRILLIINQIILWLKVCLLLKLSSISIESARLHLTFGFKQVVYKLKDVWLFHAVLIILHSILVSIYCWYINFIILDHFF